MESYGQPALVKLLNNTLATYNLAATARMLNLGAHLGVPAPGLLEVIGVSTGQSWMSDNLPDVQYHLLLKDVGLLRNEIGSLPRQISTMTSKRQFFRRVGGWVLIQSTGEVRTNGWLPEATSPGRGLRQRPGRVHLLSHRLSAVRLHWRRRCLVTDRC
jgi:hypothetical protein